MNNPVPKTFPARAVVRLASIWVPPRLRTQWLAEWHAELNHEAGAVGAGSLRLVWLARGAIRDARTLQHIERERASALGAHGDMQTHSMGNTIMQSIYAWAAEVLRALRNLRRYPLHGTVVIVTLALGIGGATAIFSLLDHTVFRPLPYPEADRLVRLKNQVPGAGLGTEWQLSPAQYFFYLENSSSFEEIGVFNRSGVNVETTEGPVRAEAVWATASLLGIIGARAQLGQLFDAAQDVPGGPSIALISHGFWTRQFGQDPGVVGQTISMDGDTREIVGVMVPGVTLSPDPGAFGRPAPDIWVPRRLNPEGPFVNSHNSPAIGRLKSNVSAEDAEVELELLVPRLPEAFPTVYSMGFFDRYGFRTVAYPLTRYTVGEVAQNLWLLGGAVLLVLFIAAANVTNLFLVRLEGRHRELVVRSALGAGKSGIRRTVFAESIVLAVFGGLLGWGMGLVGVKAVFAVAADMIPMAEDFVFTGVTTVSFAALLSLWAGLGVGAISLFQQRRRIENGGLHDGRRGSTAGREAHRLNNGLVVMQVAFALTLAISAGLLASSVMRLRNIDPGVRPEGVVATELNVAWSRYPTNEEKWGLYREMLQRVRALPGVLNAGMITSLPFMGGYGCTVQAFDDPAVYNRINQGDMTLCAGQQKVTPGYFEALGIPLIQGRTFDDADFDFPERGAVIVSRAFAERFWPGEEPLGKGTGPNGYSEGRFYEVVGVVGDIYNNSLDEDPAIAIYYPVLPNKLDWGGWGPNNLDLVVQTSMSEPTAILPSIASLVSELDPTVPLANARSMEIVVSDSMARQTFISALLEIAAMVALALAAVGLYGVLSHMVFTRTKEIGVRMAVGATPETVVRMIVGKALALVAVGIAIGLVVSWNTTKFLQGLLFEVSPLHLPSFVLAVVVLSVVAFTASWLPARRAARIDPSETLRAD